MLKGSLTDYFFSYNEYLGYVEDEYSYGVYEQPFFESEIYDQIY